MAQEKESKLLKRRVLGRKEVNSIKQKANWLLDRIETNAVSRGEIEDGSIVYIFVREPLLVEKEATIFPTLTNSILERLPSAIVDMGAIPYVCNGADIMAPGIVEVKGEFGEGGLVVIRDIKHGKSLAIGRALYPSEKVREMKKGKAIVSLHYVGDKIWEAIT